MDMIARFARAIYDSGVRLGISKPRPWSTLAGEWANFAASDEPVQFGEIVELADAPEGDDDTIAVQILRTGTFQEMHGKLCRIEDADLAGYIANFEEGKAGQDLPVFKGHPNRPVGADEPAMAWYKRLYTRTINGVATLWADLALTPPGRKAIEEKTFRYFSPTINLQGRVLLGGGFTNTPAIKGQPAMAFSQHLTPAEDGPTFKARVTDVLKSLGLVASDPPPAQLSEVTIMSVELTEAQIEEMKATAKAEAIAEFAEQQQETAEFAATIRKEAREAALAEFTEQQVIRTEVAEFAATITGGDAGLSTPVDEVIELLMGLTEEQRAGVQKILEQKVVDFSEHGHQGSGNGGLKELPVPAAAALVRELARAPDKAKAVDNFMLANLAQLGPASEYDLSAYAG